MIRLALGSQQAAKRAAVERVAPRFWSAWRLECVSVPRVVAEQPRSDEETVAGALARARLARLLADADLGIGIESGIASGPLGRLYAVSWAVVIDRAGWIGIGGADRFPLPPSIVRWLDEGVTLGEATERAFGIELDESGGTVAILSGGRRDRVELLATAVLHALCDLQRRGDA